MQKNRNNIHDAHQAPDEDEFQIIEEMFSGNRIIRDIVIEYWEDATSLIGSYWVMETFFNDKD